MKRYFLLHYCNILTAEEIWCGMKWDKKKNNEEEEELWEESVLSHHYQENRDLESCRESLSDINAQRQRPQKGARLPTARYIFSVR